MKKKFIKTPLKGVYVHGAKDVGTRTVNLLMGEHAGEYVRGDIMDANAVIQAFDELKGNVDNNHDSLEEIVNEIHNFRDTTNHRFDVFQEKAEEETANRIQGDNTLDDKIDQKESESNERDTVLQQNIDTEKQERVNADTQLRNDLTAEVNRAKASENALSSDIHAEATKRENDDNTIKDNLNAEVTRATAKENEIKAEVDVINGDSTTEGSFRKAIADVVGAAPEAYDTLKEIADKLNSNDDLHTAINDAIATKATTVALNEEITRAKAAEAENKAEIAAEAARAKEVEGDNALAIQNEASRATTAETAINESLNTEIDRAKGQETYLQNLVNAKADTTALDGAKAELDKKISDEATRATQEEDELRSLITTEQNRATAAEKSISDDLNGKLVQKADTTALNNYVLTTVFNTQVNSITDAINSKAETTALTALEQKVTANTAAIDTKQPKGNYLTEHQSLEEYAKKTDIPAVDTSDFVSKTTTDDQIINSTLGIVGGGGIQIVDYTQDGDPVFMTLGSSVLNFDGNNRSTIELNSSDVDSNNGSHIIIEAYNENPQITLSDFATFRNDLTITNEGISSTDNNANHVYATDGSIADLTQYAKKTELPTVPTKVSQLENDSNFITSADVDFTPYATTEALTTVEQKVDANTTAISAKQDAGNYIPYNDSGSGYYQTDKNLTIKVDDANTASFGPNSCINLKSSDKNTLAISYAGLHCKVDDQNKIDIDPQSIKLTTGSGYIFSVNPGGINQVTNYYKFNVSNTSGIKWSTTNDEIYSSINPYGLFSKIQNQSYANCNCNTFVDIKSGDNKVNINPTSISATNGTTKIEITPENLTINDGTSDDSNGLKLGYNGLRIGKKSNINTDNNELISISVPFHGVTSSFKVSPPSGIMLQTGDSQVVLGFNGVTLPHGDNNHVLTSWGTTIDISQYAKKTDLPKMQFVSSLPETTDSNTLYFVI